MESILEICTEQERYIKEEILMKDLMHECMKDLFNNNYRKGDDVRVR